MISITLRELEASFPDLVAVGNMKPKSERGRYWLAKTLAAAQKEISSMYKQFDLIRADLIEPKDSATNEEKDAYAKMLATKYDEVRDITVELNVHKVKYSDIPEDTTARQLAILLWLFEEPAEDLQ